ITVHDNPRALTFQLEGRLAGPSLRELEECWRGTLARRHKRIRRVDLTGVTFIDAAGKACLAALHRPGAEVIAADCLTKAVVAEIAGAPFPTAGVRRARANAGRDRTEVQRENQRDGSPLADGSGPVSRPRDRRAGNLRAPRRPSAGRSEGAALSANPSEVSMTRRFSLGIGSALLLGLCLGVAGCARRPAEAPAAP